MYFVVMRDAHLRLKKYFNKHIKPCFVLDK